MKTNETNNFFNERLDDYRRENQILINETIDNKAYFADNIKDVLGEEIKKELLNKKVIEDKNKQKDNKIKKFFDKLAIICR